MPVKNINIVHCAKGTCALLEAGLVIKDPESAFINGCSGGDKGLGLADVCIAPLWVKRRRIYGIFFFSLQL